MSLNIYFATSQNYHNGTLWNRDYEIYFLDYIYIIVLLPINGGMGENCCFCKKNF